MMPSYGTMAANANQPINNPFLQASSTTASLPLQSSTTSPPFVYPQPSPVMPSTTPESLLSYMPVSAPPLMMTTLQTPYSTTPMAAASSFVPVFVAAAPRSLATSQGLGTGTGLSQTRKGSADGYAHVFYPFSAPRNSNTQQMGLGTKRGGDATDVFDPLGIGVGAARRGKGTWIEDAEELLCHLGMGGGVVKKKKGWEAEEDAEKLCLSVDMPGLGKEHVAVSVEKKTILVIHGANKQEPADHPSPSISATGTGSGRKFNFKFHFPKGVFKMDGIKGEMKNGLLELTLQKLKLKKDVVKVQVD